MSHGATVRRIRRQVPGLLKKQARHSNFGEALDHNLGDQLIEKLLDIEWKKKLLEARNVSLGDAMDKVRLWE